MIHVFHHNDADGFSSAAIVRRAFQEENIRYICCNYSFPLSNYAAEIQSTDYVFIVDYSFKANTLCELNSLLKRVGRERLVWIDHHVSSEALINSNPELRDIKGVVDTRFSAVALAWMYFHNLPYCEESYLSCPYAVRLISDYDTWTKSDPNSDYFDSGLNSYDLSVDSFMWNSLFENDSMVDQLISDGMAIRRYMRQYYANKLSRYAFETTFAGYRCLAINQKDNAGIFGDKRGMYPLCVIFQTDGGRWFYTVYSSDPMIDCSKIAERFGGGGHKGAAGFMTDKLLNEFIL